MTLLKKCNQCRGRKIKGKICAKCKDSGVVKDEQR